MSLFEHDGYDLPDDPRPSGRGAVDKLYNLNAGYADDPNLKWVAKVSKNRRKSDLEPIGEAYEVSDL